MSRRYGISPFNAVVEGRARMIAVRGALLSLVGCAVTGPPIARTPVDGRPPSPAVNSAADGLQPLRYNNPGLAVDLAVGLWAWPLPLDFDGDGDLDLAVSCPDKPYNGTYVFENVSGDTRTAAMPVLRPGRRISRGLGNVGVSHVDGRAVVLGPGTQFPHFTGDGLQRPEKVTAPRVSVKRQRGEMWRLIDHDGDGVLDLLIGIDDWSDYGWFDRGWDNAFDARGTWLRGPLHGRVYVALGRAAGEAPGRAAAAYDQPRPLTTIDGAPIDVYGWPSPGAADFDSDGDLDLVAGEFLDGFTYFRNVGSRTQPRYDSGRRLATTDGRPLVMDLQMVTPTVIDWDRDGDPDLICGDEDGRVAFIENSCTLTSDGMPIFKAPRYFRQQADLLKFGALATPVGFDWDGDGDTDIVSGNSAGHLAFIENLSGPGVESPRWAEPRRLEANGTVIRIVAGPNGSIQGPAEAKWGYTTLSVADWDGDGLPDLIVNSIWGKVIWYRNLGPRRAPRLAAAQPVNVAWTQSQPVMTWGWLRPDGDGLLTQWRTTPLAVDWNRDGLVDLVMLDHEGYLAFFERARRGGQLILLPPRRVFHDVKGPLRLNTQTAGKSGRRKLSLVDWDGDGRLDILVNDINARLLRQIADSDGVWMFQDQGPIGERNIAGHDVSPTVVDFNADGIPDFLGGAEDGHFYYLRNPRSAR